MLPQYQLEVTRDVADQFVFEESPNYGDAFICLAIGVILLALAVIGISLGAEDLARRPKSFLTGNSRP